MMEEALAPSSPPSPLHLPNEHPSPHVLRTWRKAHAVCFDVDCTVANNDGLDLLAEFKGVGAEVAAITNAAMDGTTTLEDALTARLRAINPTPADIHAFLEAHPPATRLVPGAKELITALQARGMAVYLISGGFRELSLPIAKALGVPPKNLFANRMNWQWNDETGAVDKLAGFDERELTGHQFGKPKAIARLREIFPYDTIVMVGDGITDLEAVQETGGADLFVGFGGVVRRPAVAAKAEWFVNGFDELQAALKRYRVAMVGSGAWACAAVRLAAKNTLSSGPTGIFEPEIRMWVYEEEVGGQKLTDIINTRHENVKYLPGVHIGENVRAVAALEEAVEGADVVMLCLPHQFVGNIVRKMAGCVQHDAIAVSLTKGMRVRPEGPQLISELVRKELGIDCSVLMGANIAEQIAQDQLSEATIGYRVLDNAQLLQSLFQTDSFYVALVPDVAGAEMCGTLKNVVAVGVGLARGLGMGENTQSSIMREGLGEMKALSKALYADVRDETFLEACGISDLIASCLGGRNRLVAKTYAQRLTAGDKDVTFEGLEAELLSGQKLQGVLTSQEVQAILKKNKWEDRFPLFTTINFIVNGILPPQAILRYKLSTQQALANAPKSALPSVEDLTIVAAPSNSDVSEQNGYV